MTNDEKIQETNALIDHLVSALNIVHAKCGRCGSRMCMGCNLDAFARGMLPDVIEHAIDLAGLLPNSRHDETSSARRSFRERDEKWEKLARSDPKT